jgi:hypothetical protein
MPDYARSDLEIAQKACVLAGMKPPQDFAETGATESVVLNALYEDVVRDALSSTPWNFATQQLTLASRLTDAPLTKWQAAYTLPQDGTILAVNTCLVNGSVVNYDVEGDTIVLDCNANDTVTINYLKRVEVAFWPPYFTIYVIHRLAALLGGSIARSADVARAFTGLAEAQLARARSRDSQGVTARGMPLGRFMSARRGGR